MYIPCLLTQGFGGAGKALEAPLRELGHWPVVEIVPAGVVAEDPPHSNHGSNLGQPADAPYLTLYQLAEDLSHPGFSLGIPENIKCLDLEGSRRLSGSK